MERVVNFPEFAGGDPYVNRHEGIRELLELPELHEQFDAAVNAASQLAPNASALQAIAYTADILRWGYWGDYGSRSPAGLKFASTAEGMELHFDGQFLDSYLFEKTFTLISSCGFDDFTQQVRYGLNQQAERVRELTIPVLERHPVVQLFRGIAEQQEGPEITERPLTEQEKILGASVIAAETKAQFGMREAETFARGTSAELWYRRRIAQQELATVEDKPQSTVAHEMVKAVIESYADRLIGMHAWNIDQITSKEQAVRLLREEVDVYLFGEIARQMTIDLAKQPGDFHTSVVEYSLGTILRNLYQNTEGSVSRTLSMSVMDEAGELYDRLYDVMPNSLIHPQSGLEVFGQLNQPQEETAAHPPYNYDIDAAYDAMETLENTMLWENFPRIPGNMGTAQAATADHVGRLLQFKPVQAPYVSPHEVPQHDISITVQNDYAEDGGLPTIPGYTLLATTPDYTTSTFFYEANEDDPCAECPLPINAAGRQALADAYGNVGLADLSAAVLRAEALTVGELTRLVAGHSVYGSLSARPAKKIYSIEDCAEFVSDGRLIAQCTGARVFLSCSLREAFWADENHGWAFINLEGHALGLDKVPREGHVQLGLIGDGKLYILDATPSNMLQASDKQPYQLDQRARTVEHSSRQEAQATRAVYEMDNEGRLASLEGFLSRLLDAPAGNRAALQERIVQLPQDDPMRIVYQISLGFKNDPESIADLYEETIGLYPKLLDAIVGSPELLIGTVYQRYRERSHQIQYLLDHLRSYPPRSPSTPE